MIVKAGTLVSCAFLLSALCAAAQPAQPAAAPTVCPAAVPFPGGIDIIKAVRVYTAAGGESAFEDVTFKGDGKAYFKPGEMFFHTAFGDAKTVQLVSGPPNVILGPHPTPYREMFLTIQGRSSVVLPNGQSRDLTPGSLVIFDDATSKTGHGGRTGPCGYVAFNIVPADAKTKP